MKKIIAIVVLVMMAFIPAQAQILNNIANRAKNAARTRVEMAADRAVNKAMDKAEDKASDAVKSKVAKNKKSKATKNSAGAPKNENDGDDYGYDDEVPAKRQGKKAESSEVKSDFVPGTVIIFQDDFNGERMGEFPSKWDLISNNAEIARMNGRSAMRMLNGSLSEVTPLIEDGNKSYLPEVYTLEFDFFVADGQEHSSWYSLHLNNESNSDYSWIDFSNNGMSWYILKPGGGSVDGSAANYEGIIEYNDWNHFALSFNKRALKVYINDVRQINIPNSMAADWFSIRNDFWDDHQDYLTGFRLAKGGVELYDRNANSMTAIEKAMAESGKFVTNNILFDTGKATLKPESMEEIQKVADYMKKNPSVRFEVQGHTDNQGSDKVNDPLSEQRAEAIVKALAGLGVDEWNLKAVGKGSHEPVADNKTEEGRAKNRRVEFIKK